MSSGRNSDTTADTFMLSDCTVIEGMKDNDGVGDGVAGRLQEASHRYINSFTVHGVEHIAKGSLPEKVLWTIKLCGLFTVAIYFR